MERKIGEIFEYEGKRLIVNKMRSGCDSCFFEGQSRKCRKEITGFCGAYNRSDHEGVIFVEVQEQQAEETKERKVGEVFEFEGKKLQVKESEHVSCDGCFFDGKCYKPSREVAGHCEAHCRDDNKEVIFVEATEQPQEQTEQQAEQPQEQAEQQTEHQQKLNLCEVLKYCPEGEPLWSPMLGDVKLYDINQEAKKVEVESESGDTWDINADGTITFGYVISAEIMLYPSREQRDWTKVKYEPRKKRFDPNTLQPFDRVLVRDNKDLTWKINIYSHKYYNPNHPYQCITSVYRYCIPYNDDTKHLVGTKDEAPDFYRYWED